MAYIDCIKDKVKKKLITKKQADEIVSMYDKELKRAKRKLGDDDAAVLAADRIVKAFTSKTIKKRINSKLHTSTMIDLFKATEGMNQKTAARFFQDRIETASTQGNAIFNDALRGLEKFINDHKQSFQLFGEKTDKGMNDVIKSIMDNDFSGPKGDVAIGLRDSFKKLHTLYRQSGGMIGEIESWFPQVHEGQKLKQAGFDQWKADIEGKIDIDAMREKHGFVELDQDGVNDLLETVYNSITSGGRKSDTDAVLKSLSEGKSANTGKGDLDAKRDFSRFLIFKSSDGFLDYNAKYGVGVEGLYDLAISHMRSISRDIGMMRSFGPRVRSGGNYIDSLLKTKKGSRTKFQTKTSAMFQTATGDMDGMAEVGGAGEVAYNLYSGLQNLQRSAYLGSAVLSAVTDPTFISSASRMAGLRPMGVVKAYGKMFNIADTNAINRSLFLLESSSGSASGGSRLTGEVPNALGGKSAWVSNALGKASGAVFKWSGLDLFTQTGRGVATIEALGTVMDFRGKGWGELPREMRDYMSAIGANQSHWAEWRTARELVLPSGAIIANPKSVPGEAGILLDTWVSSIRELAVNDPNVRSRAFTNGSTFGMNAKRGTIGRAMVSSITMFKSFPISALNNHIIPSFQNARNGNYMQLGEIAVGTTVMGAAALQLKEIAKGNTGKDMDTGEFWMEAMAQGGSLGIYGDFIFGDQSRFGQSFLATAAGPTAGLIEDSFKLFKSNFDRGVIHGGDTKFAADAFKLLSKNMPASNIWWARAVLRRGIFDAIDRGLDQGNHDRKIKAEVKRLEKRGQKMYWKAGEFTPF